MLEFNGPLLGKRLRRLRLESGILQKDFAERLGLSVSYYGHLERGSRIPSLPTLVKICNELGVGCDQLLRDSLDAPCLPRACGGWTNLELGIFRQYMEERSLSPDEWFGPEEEAPETEEPEEDQEITEMPW
ncbi:MAG: helix-turn-helix transcriptional regulator [Clostridia bacterium]|nr:helix-turn-helix transcriptional regulator [Clostridia bacterium]